MSNEDTSNRIPQVSSQVSDHVGPEFPGRRSFFAVLTAVGTVAVSAVVAVPLFRFALYPLLKQASGTPWSDAGDLSQFNGISEPTETQIEVEQIDGWRESITQKAIYVLPTHNGKQRVLSTVCPHLGCEVQWQQDMTRFFCPCHGSVFAPDGSLIQGPAARGMDYLECRLENGKLMVLYQYFRLLTSKREVIG